MKFKIIVVILLFLLFSKTAFADQNGTAGINIDPNNPGGRPSASDLKILGASWVRFVYNPNTGFDYDSYISELNQAGLKVTLVLNQETTWPVNGIDANYINNFAQTAGNVAKKFGDSVASYEIWNEEDQNSNASLYISPELYGKLLATSFNAIKTQNNNANVLTGGLVSGDLNYLREVIDSLGGLPADGVGVHPYTTDLNSLKQSLDGYLSLAQKPLWITEFGWEVADQQRQADYLKNVYELISQFGDKIPAALWYGWSDAMNPGFGLVDQDGNPKLAFLYFQKYAALLKSIITAYKFKLFPLPSPAKCGALKGDGYLTDCGGPPITLNEIVSYCSNDPSCISKTFSGEIRVNNFDIPFAEHINNYFTGVLDYDHITPDKSQNLWRSCVENPIDCQAKTGVAKKLFTKNQQDKLKLDFLDEIQARISRGEDTRYVNFRIQGLGPAQIKQRFLKIPKDDDKKTEADRKFEREVWYVVPLFANEKTEGDIYFGGDGISGNIKTSVPETYRLSKITKTVQDLLMSRNDGSQANLLLNKEAKNIARPEPSPEGLINKLKNLIPDSLASALKEPPQNLLAEGQSSCFHLSARSDASLQADGSIAVNVYVQVNSDGGDGHIQLFVDGGSSGTRWGWNKNAVNPFEIFPEWNGGTIVIPPSGTKSRSYGVKIDECGDRGNFDSLTCNFTNVGGVLETNCNASPANIDTCPPTLETNANGCSKNSVPGPPQTSICTEVKSQSYPNFFGSRQFKNDIYDPQKSPPPECKNQTFVAQVNIQNTVPYLDPVAEQTIGQKGIFRIFIPWAKEKGFLNTSEGEVAAKTKEMDNPLPARDDVGYSLTITNKDPGLEVNSPSGSLSLLFAKLGTVYNIKNWVVQKVLAPVTY